MLLRTPFCGEIKEGDRWLMTMMITTKVDIEITCNTIRIELNQIEQKTSLAP